MSLRDVFPRDELIARIDEDVVFSEYSLQEIDDIIGLKSSSVFELGATIWDRYMQRHPNANPQQFSDHFDNDEPQLYEAISEFVGEPTIDELYYVHAELTDAGADYRTVGELLIAAAYPNVIHISDVEFSNPREPIPEEERCYTHQHFKGLGLLPVLLANAVQYGGERGAEAICMTAAHVDLVPLFEGHGFVVDDTPAGQIGLAVGGSVPMHRSLTG